MAAKSRVVHEELAAGRRQIGKEIEQRLAWHD
jgi:hypothetical protein